MPGRGRCDFCEPGGRFGLAEVSDPIVADGAAHEHALVNVECWEVEDGAQAG
jgi:hypothetical protein